MLYYLKLLRHSFTSQCHKIFSMTVLLVSLEMSSGSTVDSVDNPGTRHLETVRSKKSASNTESFAISHRGTVQNNTFSKMFEDSIKEHRNYVLSNISSKLARSDNRSEATQMHFKIDSMKTKLNSNIPSKKDINLLEKLLQNKKEDVLSAVSINSTHLRNMSDLHGVLQKERGQGSLAAVLSREKRNGHCSSTVRERAICPWHYEYPTNYTLLPETVQAVSCSGSVPSIDRLLIQCHQLYTNTLFKLRNCIEGPETSCYVMQRVKSGCQATFPCIIPAQN